MAIDLAARLDCEVTGLAVLDRKHITSPTAVGIGGMAYKHHRDQVKLEEAKAFLERIEQGSGKAARLRAPGFRWSRRRVCRTS